MDAIEKVLHECGQKPQALMILGLRRAASPLFLWRSPDVMTLRSSPWILRLSTGAWTSARQSDEGGRAVCPHHLIDIRDIGEAYSAADFWRMP